MNYQGVNSFADVYEHYSQQDTDCEEPYYEDYSVQEFRGKTSVDTKSSESKIKADAIKKLWGNPCAEKWSLMKVYQKEDKSLGLKMDYGACAPPPARSDGKPIVGVPCSAVTKKHYCKLSHAAGHFPAGANRRTGEDCITWRGPGTAAINGVREDDITEVEKKTGWWDGSCCRDADGRRFAEKPEGICKTRAAGGAYLSKTEAECKLGLKSSCQQPTTAKNKQQAEYYTELFTSEDEMWGVGE